MERLFDLDAQFLHDVVFMGVSVFVLFLVLSYLLFDPVRKVLDDRKEKIQNDKDAAATAKSDAAQLKEQYEAKLREVDKEAEEILSDARKKASLNEAKIIDEAKLEAKRITDRARAEIELERKGALDDMKKEIVSIAAVMAEKVVDASIDIKVQDQLIDETLKEMGDQTWQS